MAKNTAHISKSSVVVIGDKEYEVSALRMREIASLTDYLQDEFLKRRMRLVKTLPDDEQREFRTQTLLDADDIQFGRDEWNKELQNINGMLHFIYLSIKMFYNIEIEDYIRVEPKLFGLATRDAVEKQLQET